MRPLSIAHFQPKRRRTHQCHPHRSEQFRRANRSEFNRLNGLHGRRASAMRPRAIIWRRCPASAALNVLLAPFAPLRSTLTPDTAAKALASRFNRAPPVAARPETKTMNERPNMFAQNDAPLSIHSRAELHDDQLRALAPSVFAAQAMPGVSSRYAFVPTAHLVARLREAGWAPVSAVEQRIKIEDR